MVGHQVLVKFAMVLKSIIDIAETFLVQKLVKKNLTTEFVTAMNLSLLALRLVDKSAVCVHFKVTCLFTFQD